MIANDYPVNFPYGATTPPYGTAAFPFHRGNDRATPSGTKIYIGATLCALTGNTGMTTGPHLHIQEWKDTVYNTRTPQHEFQGGTVNVVSTDPTQQWGKNFTITNPDGWNTTYCHLSEIYVKNGQTVQGENMNATREQLIEIYSGFVPNQPVNYQWVNGWTGKDMNEALQNLRDDPSRQAYITRLVNNAAAYEKLDVKASEKLEQIKQIVVE